MNSNPRDAAGRWRAGCRVARPVPALFAALLLSGCGTTFDRAVYDTLNNVQRQQRPCVAPVPTDCPKTPSYEQYRRERDAAQRPDPNASDAAPGS